MTPRGTDVMIGSDFSQWAYSELVADSAPDLIRNQGCSDIDCALISPVWVGLDLCDDFSLPLRIVDHLPKAVA